MIRSPSVGRQSREADLIIHSDCATRSGTVGIPRILIPPLLFGMATAFTAGEKSVPDESRFQIL